MLFKIRIKQRLLCATLSAYIKKSKTTWQKLRRRVLRDRKLLRRLARNIVARSVVRIVLRSKRVLYEFSSVVQRVRRAAKNKKSMLV